ncbi:MAG: toll/interleukin-1 receptor domain-containing protein [Vicinamibacterales bacterium]
MGSTTTHLRNGYDAFLSHNHRDKAWVRTLADRLANVDFRGRPLRPWLDERVLDPGELGQKAELTSALDRSRTLVLVLSPASVASKWVEFEVEYFLRDRPLTEVIPLLNAPCNIPKILDGAEPLDFTDAAAFETTFATLVARLCPPAPVDTGHIDALVDQAWDAALAADPGGLDAEPSAPRDAILEVLLRFPIDGAETEGLAVTGFLRAARLLLRDQQHAHPAAYNMQMLLGECVGVAVQRHPRYRQIAQRFLDLQPADSPDPVLAFVVVRAYSKLAEIDPTLIDAGALLRVAALLDSSPPLNNKKASAAMLLGRVAAKLRGNDMGDLLIQVLSEGGAAARIAAIGAISMAEARASSVFYTSAFAALHATTGASTRGTLDPPSRKLQARLYAIDIDQPPVVRQQFEIAKDDLRRAFAIDDLPTAYSWFALRRAPAAASLHHAPFMGTVAEATAANMEALALEVNASNVVCLTEPRIVDALFDRAGALLVPSQDEGSPQCRRLIGRAVPFAMLDSNRMKELKDGDQIEIEAELTRIVKS